MRGCLGEGEWDELEVWDRHICMCVHAKSLQSCLTVCYPMDCSLLGFSVHGILLARIPEWVAIPFSRGLPDPGIKAESRISGRLFTVCTIREALSYILYYV